MKSWNKMLEPERLGEAPIPALSALPLPPNSLPERRAPNKYIDELTNEYIESMGKTEDLKLALSRSNSLKAQHFLSLLLNPRNSEKSVTRLATMAGIQSVDLFDIFRDYYHSQGMMNMVKRTPVIAEHIAEDSLSIQIDCPRCEGFGQVGRIDVTTQEIAAVICPRCEGSGKARKSGDADARKLLAETVGWTKRGGGPSLNINITNGASRVESVIDELERANPRRQQTIEVRPEEVI